MIVESGFPCPYCGVNSWTACHHRAAQEHIAGKPTKTKAASTSIYVSGGGSYRVSKKRMAALRAATQSL